MAWIHFSIFCHVRRTAAVDAYGTKVITVIALLVLGLYRILLERIGLRRVIFTNLCCSALAVAYSMLSCRLRQWGGCID